MNPQEITLEEMFQLLGQKDVELHLLNKRLTKALEIIRLQQDKLTPVAPVADQV